MAKTAVDQVLTTLYFLRFSTNFFIAVALTIISYLILSFSSSVLHAEIVAKATKMEQQDCPAPLATATRLVTIIARKLTDATATARLYYRTSPGEGWQPDGKAFGAVIGSKGLAWDFSHRHFAGFGEKIKREGDRRTPAGVFYAGIPFGFSPRPLANYLQIRQGVVCIDDPKSKRYGMIMKGGAPPGISHEKMWRIRLYRYGLVLRTTSNPAVRSGSCIFLHVWRGPNQPTVGCAAFSGTHMKRIQASFNKGAGAVAVLPLNAYKRFSGCGLPPI